MTNIARPLVLIRFIGLIATLATFKAGAYGFAAVVFNLRFNQPMFRFWEVSYRAAQEDVAAFLALLISLYVFLDGRAVAWIILRGVPRAEEHRCPSCGYDLSGEHRAGCSECGWGRAPAREPSDSA
ncbi:MAG: hypothetical protein RLN60_01110 [Phycisphaerales bacterium]